MKGVGWTQCWGRDRIWKVGRIGRGKHQDQTVSVWVTGGNPESGRSGERRVLSFLEVVIWTTLVAASSLRSRPKGLIHTKTESWTKGAPRVDANSVPSWAKWRWAWRKVLQLSIRSPRDVTKIQMKHNLLAKQKLFDWSQFGFVKINNYNNSRRVFSAFILRWVLGLDITGSCFPPNIHLERRRIGSINIL